MSIERNVYIVSNIFSIDVSPQQGLEVAANAYSLDVRNHHRICDAQKHLLHTLLKLKKKIIDNYMMNKRIEENVYIVSNIFSIDVSPQQRIAGVAKRIFTRCEKSSQNLGCSKTSTSHTC